jgi:hypothetical protein
VVDFKWYNKTMKKLPVLVLTLAFLFLVPSKTLAAVDYKLPYPGIMPDSPLWPLKDLRDKTIGLFLFDPVTKARYHLLQADKRFAAGLALKNKEILRWAYDYLLAAAQEPAVFPQLSLALAKYEEELGEDRTDPDFLKTKERITDLFLKRLIPNP